MSKRDADAIDYLQELYKFSEYYAKLLHPIKENNLKIRHYLQRINRLEQATVYPFLLNCYHDYDENKLSEVDFINVLQILENFIIRRFVCNVQTRGLNRIFSVLYSQVSKASNLAHADFVERLKLDLQNRDYPKDTEFQKSLLYVTLYGVGRSKKGKLILESIEESFNHKEQVILDNLDIEHIMPQTITKWWQEHLGEHWGIIHDLLLHSLGNLTLTGYNSESSNGDFNQKRSILINSHLEINKYFQNQESWKREDIEKRSLDLAERVLRIWPYFGNENLINTPKTKGRATTPKQLKIFGQEYPVKSWRDVLEKTLNVIADLEADKFEYIIEQFPRFISKDEKDFRDTRKLENGVFINVNLSARDISAFCIKAMETAELSTEDWQVETTN
ncbi:MAG: HNH endonuclease family protein [Dolichospermum sp.]